MRGLERCDSAQHGLLDWILGQQARKWRNSEEIANIGISGETMSLDTNPGRLGEGTQGSFITSVQLFCKPKFIPKQSVLKMPLVIYFFSSQLISRQAFPPRVPPCLLPPPRLQLCFCQSEGPGDPFLHSSSRGPSFALD